MKRFLNAHRNALYRMFLICCAAPIVGGFLFVYLFGTNVVFWDEWVLIPLLEKFASGILEFYDVFSMHNEHRMFFPRLAQLGVVAVTRDYNSVSFMYLILTCLLMTLAILYLQLKRQLAFERLPIWFLPIPFLVFNWRQWENLLSGFQITFVMPLLFSVLSLYFLDSHAAFQSDRSVKRRDWPFVLAILFAIIASFSMSMGLFVWIAGIVRLLFAEKNRRKMPMILTWCVLALITWRLYFFETPLRVLFHSHKTETSLILYGKYALSLPGAFFYDEPHALRYGTALILLFALVCGVAWRQKILHEYAFWLALGIYSLAILAAITLGRAPFGSSFIMWSRYNTYTFPLLISLYVLSVATALHQRRKKFGFSINILCGVVSCLIGWGLAVSYAKGFNDGRATKVYMEKAAQTLSNYKTASDQELSLLYPSAEFVKQHAPFLEAQGYSVFHDCSSTEQ